MPIPAKLKARFDVKNANQELNLNDYPLNHLTDSEFSEFVVKLKSATRLEVLNCANCGLDKLSNEKLAEMFSGLTQLVRINLDYNKLTSDQFLTISPVFRSLPKLHFISISEREKEIMNSAEIIITDLPAFRIFKKINESLYTFLNSAEMDYLVKFVNQNKIQQHYSFQPQNINQSKYKDLPENIKLAVEYRKNEKLIHFPSQTSEALQFFDELNENNVALHFCTESQRFIIDLTLVKAASIERVALRVKQNLPQNFNWEIKLPTKTISELALFLFMEISKTHPQTTIEVNTNLDPRIQKDPDFVFLKTLSNNFVTRSNLFYNMMDNKIALKNVFSDLKRILENNNPNFQDLIYQFFVAHHLCYTKEIYDLDKLAKASKFDLENFRQHLFSLLTFQPDAIFRQLDIKNFNEIFKNELDNEHSVLDLQALSQARAWWGIAAYYDANQNSSEGIYWYGRFLHELPSSNAATDGINETSLAKSNGLYWLRLAAIYYRNIKAQSYLINLVHDESKLSLADRYQLIMTLEALKLPLYKGKKYTAYDNLMTLFPSRTFLQYIFSPSKAQNMNQEPLTLNQSLSGVVRDKAYNRVDSFQFYKKYEFYLLSLMTDDLISEETKVTILSELINKRGAIINDTQQSSSWCLQTHTNMLVKYNSAPLGFQLKLKVLPVLERFFNATKSTIRSQFSVRKFFQIVFSDEKFELDPAIPMLDNSEGLRVTVFCQFFLEQLDEYLKTSTIFNTHIASDISPSYPAALIHSLLTQSLDYFKLSDTQLASALQKAMQEIKQDLQDDYFRYQLSTQSNSFGFKESMSCRFKSYATTAYLANTSKISLLKKFSESQSDEVKKHKGVFKKGIHTAALVFETFHVAIPIVLAVTGLGIPVAMGSSIVVEGLRLALKKIHHYTEVAEKVLENHSEKTDFVMGLAHMYHLSHEAEILNGHHHEIAQLVEFDAIKHFNNLLTSAAVNDIDNILVLMNHWAIIYQPITEQLTEASNTVLGILLVELLIRSLTLRLIDEKQNIFKKQAELPTTIPELLNYFNQTLLEYSHPNLSDDAVLITKDRKTFSALSIIFPYRLKVHFKGNAIEVAVQTKIIPNKFNLEHAPISRYASEYEVKELNKSHKQDSSLLFKLVNGGNPLLSEWKDLEMSIAYAENQTLTKKIALLSDKVELQQFKSEISDCLRISKKITKMISNSTGTDLEKTYHILGYFEQQFSILSITMTNFIHQIDNPGLIFEVPRIFTENPQLSYRIVMKDFIEQAKAFYILNDRQFNLKIDELNFLPLAKQSNEKLRDLMSPVLSLSDLDFIPSKKAGLTYIDTNGIFKSSVLNNTNQQSDVLHLDGPQFK